jgi:hypothetical protein
MPMVRVSGEGCIARRQIAVDLRNGFDFAYIRASLKLAARIHKGPYGIKVLPRYDCPNLGGNMTAIVLGLFVTVGIGTLALVSYLFYLTPNHHDHLE